jgi:hypothetical protein
MEAEDDTREDGGEAEEKGGREEEKEAKGVEKVTFEVKKWNAVALWNWDIEVDTCAICRSHIMDLCKICMCFLNSNQYCAFLDLILPLCGS